jgi:hypothetical protein
VVKLRYSLQGEEATPGGAACTLPIALVEFNPAVSV